jgi:hypothetical protein
MCGNDISSLTLVSSSVIGKLVTGYGQPFSPAYLMFL